MVFFGTIRPKAELFGIYYLSQKRIPVKIIVIIYNSAGKNY
jgi:hypothetical protein